MSGITTAKFEFQFDNIRNVFCLQWYNFLQLIFKKNLKFKQYTEAGLTR